MNSIVNCVALIPHSLILASKQHESPVICAVVLAGRANHLTISPVHTAFALPMLGIAQWFIV